MASTRRLAAILAADVVGYSRLMGLDETGTVAALREHRAAADPIIAEHGGRVVKTIGDGLLIEFGSVVGAVQCALGLQQLAAERNAGTPSDRRIRPAAARDEDPDPPAGRVGRPRRRRSDAFISSPAAVAWDDLIDVFGVQLDRALYRLTANRTAVGRVGWRHGHRTAPRPAAWRTSRPASAR